MAKNPDFKKGLNWRGFPEYGRSKFHFVLILKFTIKYQEIPLWHKSPHNVSVKDDLSLFLTGYKHLK